MKNNPTREQLEVLENDKKNLIVSASAGSGKTWVMIEQISRLIVEKQVPIKKMLILTFTKAAAGEMRERLNKALLSQKPTKFILEQIDDLSVCDISTIDAFCERLVRRNIDRLPLDENFRIIEDGSLIKQKSFECALEDCPNLDEIYFSFRNNKAQIFEVMCDLDNFFGSLENGQEELGRYINSQNSIYLEACKAMNEALISDLDNFKDRVRKTKQKMKFCSKYEDYCDLLSQIMSIETGSTLYENVNKLKSISIPYLPKLYGSEKDEKLGQEMKALRGDLCDFIESFEDYNFDEQELLEKEQNAVLARSLLLLYKDYCKIYSGLKESEDLVDFVDIENMALKLVKDDDILKSLQEKYDYIFIDEYQDTNRLQEGIIKPIAEKYFIAVGDPKQGVYGFRNATMEIMQSDIQTFSSEDDGNVVYLRGNFRSDKRILDFVNLIFEKIMTTDSTGIDYMATSHLEGFAEFKQTNIPTVRIDIVADSEEKEKIARQVYSVKNASMHLQQKNELEVETIIARIDSLLMSEIYDDKLKCKRKVQFDDIAILMRNRSSLMGELALKLSQRGYPVVSDVRQTETEESEVLILINLLKLLLNMNNDVALISVLNSQLVRVDLSTLASARLKNMDADSFYEVVKGEQSIYQSLCAMLEKLKQSICVNGISKALSQLFVEKDYYAYLRQEKPNAIISVQNFLHDIRQIGDDDIGGVIAYFEKIGGKRRNIVASGGGAIKLMTIHASKGLEYPIVILAGAGNRLEKPNQKSYAINSKFGLGTYIFNQHTNQKAKGVVMQMILRQEKRKQLIDEIMIFYVALTRAQNHLYIVGKEGNYNENLKTYFDIIFSALGENDFDEVVSKGSLKKGDIELNYVTEVSRVGANSNNHSPLISESQLQGIKDYFAKNYQNREACEINLKNSVTSLNTHKIEKILTTKNDQDFVRQGNAYHEALKILNFGDINSLQDLEKALSESEDKFTSEYIQLIDKEILFKNIILLKNIIYGKKIFKEKQFIMALPACEILDTTLQDEIIVQGVCDLFAIGDENILIDFKFTQEINPEKIIKRYSKQLDLYSKAIEKGFNIKLNKKYILSLKNAQLIEYFN